MSFVALTANTSILSAVVNCLGYEAVFSRPVEALGLSGDLRVGISTSDNSCIVVAPRDTARIQEARIFGVHMHCDWVELDWLKAQSVIAQTEGTTHSVRTVT